MSAHGDFAMSTMNDLRPVSTRPGSICFVSVRACAPAALCLALAACNPPPAPPEPAEPIAQAASGPSAAAGPDKAVDAALAGTDAVAVVHHPARDPEGFDRKALAGAFAGTLPCADCPGIDTTLRIEGDGRFALAETRQGGSDRIETTGTWTVDASGERLLLDPDSKRESDRSFAIASSSELQLLDDAGNPHPGSGNLSLRRN